MGVADIRGHHTEKVELSAHEQELISEFVNAENAVQATPDTFK
jgi:hypothetical protein